MLLARNVQEKLDDDNAVAREIAFETPNVLETLLPDIFCDQGFRKFLRGKNVLVNAHDEDFFVVRAIKNSDFSPLGDSFVRAPEIVVVQLFVAWRLERMDVAALRVDAGHDVFDDAVFAGRVHSLQNDQERPAILRIEFFLHAAEKFYAVVEKFRGAFLVVQFAGAGRIKILEAEVVAVGDAIGLGKFCGGFRKLLVVHGDGKV